MVSEALLTAEEARIPGATRRLIDARLRILRYHAFGSSMSQPLPVEVIFSSLNGSGTFPQPGGIAPSEVILRRDPKGRIEPVKVRLAISGNGLDAVDLGKIDVALGSATIRKRELVSGTLFVEVEIRSAKVPALVLRLPVDPRRLGLPSGTAEPGVLTRPVLLSVR